MQPAPQSRDRLYPPKEAPYLLSHSLFPRSPAPRQLLTTSVSVAILVFNFSFFFLKFIWLYGLSYSVWDLVPQAGSNCLLLHSRPRVCFRPPGKSLTPPSFHKWFVTFQGHFSHAFPNHSALWALLPSESGWVLCFGRDHAPHTQGEQRDLWEAEVRGQAHTCLLTPWMGSALAGKNSHLCAFCV